MNYETIITIICVMLAATVIAVSFRFAYWRNRAEKAEMGPPIMLGTQRRVSVPESNLLAIPRAPIDVPQSLDDIKKLCERFDASSMKFAGMNTVSDISSKSSAYMFDAFIKSMMAGDLTETLNNADKKAKFAESAVETKAALEKVEASLAKLEAFLADRDTKGGAK